MRFYKGMTPWNKGKPRTWESHSFEKGHNPWNKDKHDVMPKGEDHYKYKGGKPKCLTCKKELSTYNLGHCNNCKGLLNMDDNNKQWKEDAGYRSIHYWVRTHKGKPTFCFIREISIAIGQDVTPCGKRYEWASLSHKAKRDSDDYVSLCSRHHRDYDKVGEVRLN